MSGTHSSSLEPWSLAGKTAIVTGGSRGIGRAIALHLSRKGLSKIAITYVANRDAAQATLDQCRELGIKQAVAIQADALDPDFATKIIGQILKELNTTIIDILVNNAVLADPTAAKPIGQATLSNFLEVMHANVYAPVSLTTALLPHLPNHSICRLLDHWPAFLLGLFQPGNIGAESRPEYPDDRSLYSAGGLIGCLTVGWLADKMGRKRSIQIICAICVAASVFTTASVNIGMFLAGRGIQGLGSGMIDTICPLYQSEISPAHGRGRMVGMHAFFLVSGYIKQQVELDRASERSWLALWKIPTARKRMIFGFLVMAIAQSSGVLVINNYQTVLYEGLGVTGWKALLLSIYTSWAAFMNWINAILLDRIGQIKLMVIGMTGAAIAISCESAMVARFAGTDNAVGNGFGVLFLFLFITFFAGEMDASCYVYLSEIFPTWMRAQGVSFSIAGLFTTTLLYTGSASFAFSEIGWKHYLVFVFTSLVGASVIWYFFPETNGLSLEEISVLFGDEVATAAPELTANGMKGVHT
ncbi:hypothetical protein FOBRF1_006998 [Fusarium oxysporum]